jgi:uncharacterized membrane protein
VPLLAAATLVIRGVSGRGTRVSPWARQRLIIATTGILLVALLTKTAMLVPTGALILGAVLVLTRPLRRADAATYPWGSWTPTDRLVTWFVIYGALLPVIPEFVFLRDAFDNRMNTMFKVDYQSWVILMLAGAYGIVTLVMAVRASVMKMGERITDAEGAVRTGRPVIATPWMSSVVTVGLVIFALMAAAYPAIVTYQKTGHWTGNVGTDFPGVGEGWLGLDGLAYVRSSNPDEYQAALWLRAHAGQDDRIVEAVGNSYGDANGWFQSRFAAATGVPDLLGWYFHEVQWRNGDTDVLNHLIPARAADIGTIYNTTNAADARALLAQYQVRWVIVGADETVGQGNCPIKAGCPPYAAAGLAKFADMLELAFHSGEISVFRVP